MIPRSTCHRLLSHPLLFHPIPLTLPPHRQDGYPPSGTNRSDMDNWEGLKPDGVLSSSPLLLFSVNRHVITQPSFSRPDPSRLVCLFQFPSSYPRYGGSRARIVFACLGSEHPRCSTKSRGRIGPWNWSPPIRTGLWIDVLRISLCLSLSLSVYVFPYVCAPPPPTSIDLETILNSRMTLYDNRSPLLLC